MDRGFKSELEERLDLLLEELLEYPERGSPRVLEAYLGSEYLVELYEGCCLGSVGFVRDCTVALSRRYIPDWIDRGTLSEEYDEVERLERDMVDVASEGLSLSRV